jgi:hypothetical protein
VFDGRFHEAACGPGLPDIARHVIDMHFELLFLELNVIL